MDQKLFNSLGYGSIVRVTRSGKLYQVTNRRMPGDARAMGAAPHFRQLRDGKLFGRDFLPLKASSVELVSHRDTLTEVEPAVSAGIAVHEAAAAGPRGEPASPRAHAALQRMMHRAQQPPELPVVGSGEPATSAYTEGELQIDGSVRAALVAMVRPGTPEKKAWPWCCQFHSGGGYPADPCSATLPIPAMRVDMTAAERGPTPAAVGAAAAALERTCCPYHRFGGRLTPCADAREPSVEQRLERRLIRAAQRWAAAFPCPPRADDRLLHELWVAAERLTAHDEGREPTIEGDQTPRGS